VRAYPSPEQGEGYAGWRPGGGALRIERPPLSGGKTVRNYTPEEATEFARRQRQEPSRAELLLWQALRGGRVLGVKFKRQVPFGVYTADFSCAAARIIVEIDGPSHVGR
jgi:very-short-patch-repair endonuclease